jgi:hypothetical protein
LPGSSHRKCNDGRVVEKTEKRNLVRNQIEWIQEIRAGALGAAYLKELRRLLENPTLLLM